LLLRVLIVRVIIERSSHLLQRQILVRVLRPGAIRPELGRERLQLVILVLTRVQRSGERFQFLGRQVGFFVGRGGGGGARHG